MTPNCNAFGRNNPYSRNSSQSCTKGVVALSRVKVQMPVLGMVVA